MYALGCALVLVCFAWNRIALDGPFAESIGPFVTSWVVAWALYVAAACLVLRRRTDAVLPAVLVFALAFRVVLIFAPPLLETDPERYLWDGAVTVAGVNPYRWAPREVFDFGRAELIPQDARAARELVRLHGLAEDPRLSRHFLWINHPTVPTIYPPVAQGLFAAAAWLAPGNVFVLKALVVLVELGVLALVVVLLGELGRPRRWALLYAWCPLVLKEYANTGHYDPLAAFFLLASLWALSRHRRGLAGALAGAAALAKVYPLVAVAVLWRRYGLRGFAALVLTAALLALPFASAGSRAFEGAMVFGISWMRNASLYALAQAALSGLDQDPFVVPLPRALTAHAGPEAVGVALDSFVAAKLLMGVVLLAGLAWISRWRDDDARALVAKAYAAVALAFLVSPVQNPWYVGWVLPLAVVWGHAAWAVLGGTMIAYYAFHSTGGHVRAGIDLRLVEYAPFFLVLALELFSAGAASAGSGTLTGRVVLDGEVPKLAPLRINSDTHACGTGTQPSEALILDAERGVKNCVVVVETREPATAPPRPEALLDQQKCVFVPHVQTVLAGQELAIRNSDPAYHNVHAFTDSMADEFNIGLPALLKTDLRQKLINPGPLVIRCDAGHTWMRAYVYVVTSPFDAVTRGDGRFRIEGVPPGKQTVRIWHELVGEVVTPVDVPDSGELALTVRATLRPERAFHVEVAGAKGP